MNFQKWEHFFWLTLFNSLKVSYIFGIKLFVFKENPAKIPENPIVLKKYRKLFERVIHPSGIDTREIWLSSYELFQGFLEGFPREITCNFRTE